MSEQHMTTATAGGVAEAGLPALPFPRPDLLDIAPLYRSFQADLPLARVRTPAGDVAWLATRYDDVKALLMDERLGRSHPDPERAPRFANSAVLGGPTGDYASEKADHARMRRALTPAFSARRMQALEPRVKALVDELLDGLAARTPPVDFHEAVAVPLPVLVICQLLGVPYADREQFRAWSDRIADLRDRKGAAAAWKQLGAYMAALIERKRRAPEEDVISDLVAIHDDQGRLSEREMVSFAVGLLFAGHETTVARLDFGTLLLLAHPEQRAALQADPALAPRVVEEILRVAAPSDGALPRYAHADIALGGETIRRGEAVLLGMEAANRDGGAFPEPDRFDPARPANPHLTFGYGPRYCLGASLARVELQAVFATLFRRFPSLRLAVPREQLHLRRHLLTGGLEALPVAW